MRTKLEFLRNYRFRSGRNRSKDIVKSRIRISKNIENALEDQNRKKNVDRKVF